MLSYKKILLHVIRIGIYTIRRFVTCLSKAAENIICTENILWQRSKKYLNIANGGLRALPSAKYVEHTPTYKDGEHKGYVPALLTC